MKLKIAFLLGLLLTASASQAQVSQLTPLVTFGTNGNGSILPGQRPYLTDGTTNTGVTVHELQRSMAYNPATGHLLILSRTNTATQTSPYCAIIDAATGNDVGSLAFGTPGVGANAGFDFNVIAVAADGGIYIGDQTSSSQSGGSSPGSFNLYYWASESGSMVELTGGGPGFNGDPSSGNTSSGGNSRWGDSMAVTGTGMNTQVLLSSRGNVFAILTPSDPTLTQPWTVNTLTTTIPGGNIGYALAFGPSNNTFYAQTEGGPLYLFSYSFTNGVGGTATVIQTNSTSLFPGQTGAIAVSSGGNLLAGLEMPPNSGSNVLAANLRLYNIANTSNAPALLDRQAWVTNETYDGILAGSVCFAGTNLYVLESDNGIMAFNIFSGSQPTFSTAIILQPASTTAYFENNATFAGAADGIPAPAYRWYFGSSPIANATNAVLTVSNVMPASLGQYYFVASNSLGMATSSVATLSEAVAFANGVIYEPFSYATNSPLQGLGGWVTNSPAVSSQPLSYIAAGNLAGAGLPAAIGNHYLWASNLTARLPFGTQTNGPVYFSFTERATNALPNLTTEDAFAGLAYFSSTTLYPKIDCIWSDSNHYQLGIAKGTGTTHIATNQTVFTSTDVVFVVACLVMTNNNSSNLDIVEMWVNPDPSTFGKATPPAPNCFTNGGSGDPATGVDRFSCRGITTTVTHEIDELRVGFTWAAVTPPTPVKLGITGTASNVTVSWPTNAAGWNLTSKNAFGGGTWATNTPIVQGTNYTFTTNNSASQQYFRLVR